MHDVSDQAALSEDDSFYKAALSHAGAAIVILETQNDSTGPQIVFSNPDFTRMTGYSAEEALGRSLRLLEGPRTEQTVAESLRRHLAAGQPFTGETLCYRKDGAAFHLEWSLAPIQAAPPSRPRFIGLARDVTATKSLIEQLNMQIVQGRQHNAELEAQRLKLLAVGTKMQAQQRHLAESNARLQTLATLDGLTGLANQRAFYQRLHAEVARAQRHNFPLTLLLMDVDYFKHYNDTYGHPAGDKVLQMVARLLSQAIRKEDFAARYGGEEFAVLLPQTEREIAARVAERIRAIVQAHPFAHREITLSIGLAAYPIGDQADARDQAEALVAGADRALFVAKREGRNRVADDPGDGQEAGNSYPDDTSDELASSPDFQEPDATLSAIIHRSVEAWLCESADRILSDLVATFDIAVGETEGHSQRVARFALRLAQEMARLDLATITPGDLRELAFGALLHNLGELDMSQALRQNAPTREKRRPVRRNDMLPLVTLIEHFPLFAPALPVLSHARERWDGTGQPARLAGTAIPLSARILAVADALDSRKLCGEADDLPGDYSQIREIICAQSGKQFDPGVVQAFLNVSELDWQHLFAAGQDSAHSPLPSLETV